MNTTEMLLKITEKICHSNITYREDNSTLDDVPHTPMSLPDLLADSDAMKALFGGDEVCPKCGSVRRKYSSGRKYCGFGEVPCGHIEPQPAWLYHALKALEIMLTTKSQDEAIAYLYEEMNR